MGSGDWFKSMISSRKSKEGRSKKVKVQYIICLLGLNFSWINEYEKFIVNLF